MTAFMSMNVNAQRKRSGHSRRMAWAIGAGIQLASGASDVCRPLRHWLRKHHAV